MQVSQMLFVLVMWDRNSAVRANSLVIDVSHSLSDRAVLCRPTVHDLVVFLHVVWVDPDVTLDAKDALRVAIFNGGGIYLPLGRTGGG